MLSFQNTVVLKIFSSWAKSTGLWHKGPVFIALFLFGDRSNWSNPELKSPYSGTERLSFDFIRFERADRVILFIESAAEFIWFRPRHNKTRIIPEGNVLRIFNQDRIRIHFGRLPGSFAWTQFECFSDLEMIVNGETLLDKHLVQRIDQSCLV